VSGDEQGHASEARTPRRSPERIAQDNLDLAEARLAAAENRLAATALGRKVAKLRRTRDWLLLDPRLPARCPDCGSADPGGLVGHDGVKRCADCSIPAPDDPRHVHIPDNGGGMICYNGDGSCASAGVSR
jgi:hypothetical protein